ncbi:glycosyltransferase family 9 protein [Pseudarthrobacter sp. NamB4]|uniref:glycosyltransferase family 9 protein n=1 Tax=Pseudarthrobacter sp. NamB4 TaxID=2576837 RepID=UPI0010FF0383|nr:glycosyltransferase family 9 protein [Pseudarthrobacter sp. NamB4]TLM73113.1 glycosyltransferase family 9 protein [Pseudarthrobacter sp. NamB4]
MHVEQLTAEFGGSRQVGIGVGPVLEKFQEVSRIVVLRGGGLGDLIFAIPAMAALKAAYPGATLTLLGTPAHKALLAATESPVDEVCVLPFAAGVRPGEEDAAELDAFFADMRGRRFDLAVQVHGGGRYSNPFLLRLGARHTVGTRTADAASLERTVPYIYYQHEPLRALEVAGLAGAFPVDLEARLAPADGVVPPAVVMDDDGGQPLVVMHPGATDPRRRWPVERFAELAAACAADGFRVDVVGDSSEQQLAEEIVRLAASSHVRSLAGKLDMGGLVSLLAVAAVVVGNDSGPRHLAQALGVPTVGIFWAGNVINAGALGRSLHRIHAAWVTVCPSCGIDVTQVGWTAPRCEHDDSVVASVGVQEVYEDVRSLVATDTGRQDA